MSGQAKHLASISLGIMGAGFIATLPFQQSVIGSVLQGGFEAGLVGGLADWFAVTALFRHPMGVPIPHTALLPKNRKRITNALVSTIENEWLNKQSIIEKMRQIRITEKIFEYMERELCSDSVKQSFVSISRHLLLAIRPDTFVSFIESELRKYMGELDTRSILQYLAREVVDREYDEKALDFLLGKIGEWAIKGETRHKLGGMLLHALENIEVDGFMQFALKSFTSIVNEDKMGGIIQNFIVRAVSNLRHTNDPNRVLILQTIRSELGNLKDNEKFIAELDEWKNHWIDQWEIGKKVTGILLTLQQKALSFIEKPEYVKNYLLPFLTGMLEKWKNSPSAVEKFENWIQQQIARVIEENHSKIGRLVQENLDKLDNETLIHMVEDKIGGDLQWIRVNGALCGFLIGLVLVGVKAIL
ncbi:DUF445 domain-containing protein [Aneurinibacillus terranovensis]|uniref:DUF445 domain-containing protein n=1 Tax=Aneurinibacillus terranovensis TaxID=278991 RepID=UPI000489BFEC|nr:DUF445 domain-containing protein [Aneurinibacillus terranovensis]